jgi:hypothetical protein
MRPNALLVFIRSKSACSKKVICTDVEYVTLQKTFLGVYLCLGPTYYRRGY